MSPTMSASFLVATVTCNVPIVIPTCQTTSLSLLNGMEHLLVCMISIIEVGAYVPNM